MACRPVLTGKCQYFFNYPVEETVHMLHQDNNGSDFRVLNCGFGLGIVRGLQMKRRPAYVPMLLD